MPTQSQWGAEQALALASVAAEGKWTVLKAEALNEVALMALGSSRRRHWV